MLYACISQFIEVQDQNRLLESQTLSLQQRLNNLLVRIYSGLVLLFVGSKHFLRQTEKHGRQCIAYFFTSCMNMQYQYIDKKENMHIGNGFEFCFSSISFFCIERRNDPVYVWDNPNTRFLYVIYCLACSWAEQGVEIVQHYLQGFPLRYTLMIWRVGKSSNNISFWFDSFDS